MLPPTTTLISKADVVMKHTTIILSSSADWHGWYMHIQNQCQQLQIWEYVDPGSDKEAPKHLGTITPSTVKEGATLPSELSTSEQVDFKYLKDEYQEYLAEYNHINSVLADISNKITTTISHTQYNLLHSTNAHDALKMLQV